MNFDTKARLDGSSSGEIPTGDEQGYKDSMLINRSSQLHTL